MYKLEKIDKNTIPNWELANYCEIDKFASKSYCAIHGVDESLNIGDITKVDENKMTPFNMICGGSPCQDFSIAGKQAGSMWKCNDCENEYNPLTVHFLHRDECPNCHSKNLDKTRSSLLVEWLRVVRANKPAWGIYENVKNIVGKSFRSTFDMFINELHEYGYNTYWKVLNAKDFGIPQNRERLYLVIIKKELDNGKFELPDGFDSDVTMYDILEDEKDVPEKYYVDSSKEKKALQEMIATGKLNKSYSNTIRHGGARLTRSSHVGSCEDENTRQGAIISKQAEHIDRLTDCANTLMARDYKGFGNQGMNAVITPKSTRKE